MISLRFFCIIFCLSCFCLHNSCLNAQSHTVYLIGDAGEDKESGPTLLLLQKYLEADSNSTVIFLGDNAYPKGIVSNRITINTREPYFLPECAHLLSQLVILKKYKGNVFFVPGNHDWKAQKMHNAQQCIKNEWIACEQYFNYEANVKNGLSNNFILNNITGKIVPFSYDLSDSLSVILFDSQYFFQKINGKSRKEKWEEYISFMKITDSIITLKEKEHKKIIIASHHPLFTNGGHSRFRQPLRFLVNWTPLHVLGWFGLNRWLSQDITQPFYEKYRGVFLSVLEKHKGIIVASGHDHNLQLINHSGNTFIVSGAGSKTKKFRRKKRFQMEFGEDRQEGFVKLIYSAKNNSIEFISVDGDILYNCEMNK